MEIGTKKKKKKKKLGPNITSISICFEKKYDLVRKKKRAFYKLKLI